MESLNRIINHTYFKSLLFLIVLTGISWLYNYQDIVRYRPISIHQWRNSVSASIALNYYHEGEFFHPRTHNMQVDDHTSDITITEFPVIYYFIGIAYRLFGYNEAIFKLVNVLIGFTGLYFLFLLGLRSLKDTFYALVPPLLVFSSPIYVYYINNFILDATSLSIVLIGFYFFYRYYEASRYLDILFSLFFFGLAGLIKTPAFLLFFALIGVFGLEWVFNVKFGQERELFKNRIRTLAGFLLVLSVSFAWYSYAKKYTDLHGGVVSAVEIRPIWSLSPDTIRDTWAAIKERFWDGNYHSPILLIIVFGILIHNLLFRKRYNRLFSWLTLLCFIGGICFTILFFRSMRRHDYYQMNNLILIVLVVLNLLLYLKNNQPAVYISWITKSIVGIFLVFLIIKCNTFMENKYYGGWYMDYAMEHYNKRYNEITPYLRALGIERYDKVYCTYDPSINISLYLMDQKGFTDFYQKERTFSQKVEYFSEKGLKYVIIGDYENLDVAPEETGLEKIGEYNGVGIYRVGNF